MNVLELFAGSRSLGNEADKLGCNVFSVVLTFYYYICKTQTQKAKHYDNSNNSNNRIRI